MSTHKPRLLLIGAGTFGEKHLETLLALEKKGLLVLSGVVVRTQVSRDRIEKKYRVPVHAGLTDELLTNVDAVDIATPPETHTELVLRCLPKAHVLVEKPIALTSEDAWRLSQESRRSPYTLAVGHIYRHHPVVKRLKKMFPAMKRGSVHMEMDLVNPLEGDNGRDIELEFLHPFDIADFLFDKEPTEKFVEEKGRMREVSCRYPGKTHAVFTIGWSGTERRRALRFTMGEIRVVCDLVENTISLYERGVLKKHIDCSTGAPPLEEELRAFLAHIRSPRAGYPDAKVGARIVDIASRKPDNTHAQSQRKRIAVIGGGIFGANSAIELSAFGDVTLFEKNDDLLTEASMINQYRHHWGYHYPRSQETIDDILSAVKDFEFRYGAAIIRKFPTYYSVARKGSKVSAKEYLAFCDRNKLPYDLVFPHKKYLDREKTEVCLRTYEPIYNFSLMKRMTKKLLKKSGATVRFNTEVIDAKILLDGAKELTVKEGTAKPQKEHFDYVINATYAKHNHFLKWLGLPIKPIRLDLVETLWVKLNIPKISLAVMDGDFTNIVPTEKKNVFTLVHIKESVLRRFVPRDGLVPKNLISGRTRSRVKKIVDRSQEWFPIVKDAKVVKVHYVVRGVNAFREHDDARTSDITNHGFGCFSILGGKIIHSVTSAKYIADTIGRSMALQRQVWQRELLLRVAKEKSFRKAVVKRQA